MVFRKIDRDKPTLLLDELDAVFGNGKNAQPTHEGLRAILNAGNRRGVVVPRCGGKNRDQLQEFQTFGAKALAGIGNAPETIADRAIVVAMRRKARGEHVERFRRREVEPVLEPLRAKLAAWADANVDLLDEERPELPDDLDDRAADGWEPLLAIADLAGPDWSERARRAAIELSTGEAREEESIGVRLLADIARVFDEKQVDRLSTADLIDGLAEIEEAPWGEWYKGQPISSRKLASLLAPYGIKSKVVRVESSTPHGFKLEQLEDAFSRYMPSYPQHPQQRLSHAGLSPISKRNIDPHVADTKTAANPHG